MPAARDEHSLTYITETKDGQKVYSWECRCGVAGTPTSYREGCWQEAHLHMEESREP